MDTQSIQPHASELRAKALLLRWRTKCRRNRAANYLAASTFSRRHTILGVSAATLSVVVGTSLFVTIASQPLQHLRIVAGCLSVLAAVLGALQTFLQYEGRSSAHRRTAARYGAFVRQIEVLLTVPEAPSPKALDELRIGLDQLAEDAPELPESARLRSLRDVPLLEGEPVSAHMVAPPMPMDPIKSLANDIGGQPRQIMQEP